MLFFLVLNCLMFAPIRQFIVYIHFHIIDQFWFHPTSIHFNTQFIHEMIVCCVWPRFQAVWGKNERNNILLLAYKWLVCFSFGMEIVRNHLFRRFCFVHFYFVNESMKQQKNSNQIVEFIESIQLHTTQSVFSSFHPGALYKYGI